MASVALLAPPEDDVEFTEMGLSLLHVLVDCLSEALEADTPAAADMLCEPLEAVVEAVDALPPGSLFSEWSPRTDSHEMAVSVDATSAVADSVHSDSSLNADAAHPLAPNPASMWASEAGKKVSQWTVRLTERSNLTSVVLTWKSERGKYGAPSTVEVQVSDDGETWASMNTTTVLEALPFMKGSDSTKTVRHRVPLHGVTTSYVRLIMTDACPHTLGYHALAKFVANTVDTAHIHTDTRDTLQALERLLYSAATGRSSSPELARLAVQGLQGLSLATGSVNGVLRLSEVLLGGAACNSASGAATGPDADLNPELVLQMKDYVPRVGAIMDQELERMLLGDGDCNKPAFDPGCKSDGMSLSEDNAVTRSNGSSKHYVYGTTGFTTGKVSWEFVNERDVQGDECACYGCGVKPVTSGSYDSSSNLWMVRGYNGAVYQPGGGRGSASKIHQGDTVRFELDFADGTCRLLVNGTDHGVVFTGLSGKEVFPAVCSYGDNRVVRFTKLETEGVAGDAMELFNTMTEQSSTGHFFNNGMLSGDTCVTVDRQPKPAAIALMPYSSTNEAATVTYDLGSKSPEFVVGRVAVDDSSPVEARPVVLDVLGLGGEVLYTSVPVRKPGDSCFFRVYVESASKTPTVTLRARLADESGDTTVPAASTVLLQAGVVEPRDWSWLPGGPGRPRPAISSSSPVSVVKAVLASFSTLVSSQMHAMSTAAVAAAAAAGKSGKDAPEVNHDALQRLEVPFCIDVSAETFTRLHRVLDTVLPFVEAEHRAAAESKHEEADTPYCSIACDVMSLVTANLRRLVLSKVKPHTVGIHVASEDDSTPSTLAPLHRTLETIMNGDDHFPVKLCIAAAAAVDAGLSVLYPTSKELKQLLTSLIAKGAVAEVQFQFPTMVPAAGEEHLKETEREKPLQHDTRFDRCMVLLQVACEAQGFVCKVEGEWKKSLHLVIGLPASNPEAAVNMLDTGFRTAFTRAGFSSWQVPAGCDIPSIPLKIERYANFDDPHRNTLDAGAGVVRVYPRSAGSFEEVHAGIVESLSKPAPST